jgi:predicted RNA methylase
MVRSYLMDVEDNGRGPYGTPFKFALSVQKAFEKAGYVGPSDVATPQSIARRMSKVGGVEEGTLVLDPCAGLGSLLHAARVAGAKVFGFEQNPHLCFVASLIGDFHVRRENFLRYPPAERNNLSPDVVLLNPPVGSRAGDDATGMILRRIHRLYHLNDPQIVVILPLQYFSRKAMKRVGAGVNRLFNVEDIHEMKRWHTATLRKREVAIYHLTCQG